MARPEVLAAIRSTCESILSGHDMELVEMSFSGSESGPVLSVTVDRLGGSVPLDEIARVSDEISRALDLEDPIEGRYILEVSSAGLERPLVKPGDYVRFMGREVKVKLAEPIEGRRNFQGKIRSSNDEVFILDLDEGGVTEIPFGVVARTRLVVDWELELKGGHR